MEVVMTRNGHDPISRTTTTYHIRWRGTSVYASTTHTADMCTLVSLSRTRKICAHDVVLSMCQRKKNVSVGRVGKERRHGVRYEVCR